VITDEPVEETTEEVANPTETPEILRTESAPSDVESLKAQLAEANEAFLRARADFANFKRRTEDERESLKQYLQADILTRLLTVADDFERALAAAEQTSDYEKLVGGITGIHRKLADLLNREGVTPIEAAGKAFDPNLHNAVLRDESGEHPDNTVVEELQKGYTLGGKVLRPSLVKVAAGG
jgi:molecular chaperone GrpE